MTDEDEEPEPDESPSQEATVEELQETPSEENIVEETNSQEEIANLIDQQQDTPQTHNNSTPSSPTPVPSPPPPPTTPQTTPNIPDENYPGQITTTTTSLPLGHVTGSIYTTSVSTSVPIKLVSIPCGIPSVIIPDAPSSSPRGGSLSAPGSSTPSAISPALAVSPPATQGPASPLRVFVSRVCPISSPGLVGSPLKNVIVPLDSDDPLRVTPSGVVTVTTPVTTTSYSLLRTNATNVTSVHPNTATYPSRSPSTPNRNTIYPPSRYGLTRALGHRGQDSSTQNCVSHGGPPSPPSDDDSTSPIGDECGAGTNSVATADHNYVSHLRHDAQLSPDDDEDGEKDKEEMKMAAEGVDGVDVDVDDEIALDDDVDEEDEDEDDSDSNTIDALGPLSIDIPEVESNDADRKFVRSTRSNSRVWSPPGSNSPSRKDSSTFSDVESSVHSRNLKRRREDSGGEGTEIVRCSTPTMVPLPLPPPPPTSTQSGPVGSGGDALFYSKPVKRRCSENAAELIKACMGVEDSPRRGHVNKTRLDEVKGKMRKDELRKPKGNAVVSGESSDDEIALSELANKSRGIKTTPTCRRGTSPGAESAKFGQGKHGVARDGRNAAERSTPTRFNSRGREAGRGFREKRRAGTGYEDLTPARDALQHSTRGGRTSERGRKSPPRGREKSPLRTARGRGREQERSTSPVTQVKDEESNKRKTRSSGTSEYYDSLPQKRRRYSRDHR